MKLKQSKGINRRTMVKSSIFGLVGVSIPNLIYAQSVEPSEESVDLFHRYPAIDDDIVSDVVGSSHFDLDHVKELVKNRPELARATWDWGFGDWESALEAASHVGRRDIASFLIEMGARPNIFTLAMFGKSKAVKALIEEMPGIERIGGPHGISLLDHAYAGLRDKNLSESQITESKELIKYLEGIDGTDIQPENIELSDVEKEKYLGDYMFGDGENDGFSIKLNMRNLLSFGRVGKFGGSLYQKSKNVFTYNGMPSVEISFEVTNDKVISLTVREPDLILKANKI